MTPSTRSRALRRLLPFAAAYILLIAWSLWEASGPATFDPTAQRYGANWPGDVLSNAKFGIVELTILILILRPWSHRRSLGRALSSFLLTGAWALANFVLCMHCGTVGIAHTLWLVALSIALFGLVLWTGRSGSPSTDGTAA